MRTIISIIFVIASLSVAAADNTVRIKSAWDQKADRHLNIQTGALRSSAIEQSWHSAVWVIEPVSAGNVRIKNYWRPTEYIHMESGALASGPIQTGWLSAQWKLEPVEGTNAVRLRSAWKADRYIHIEDGVLAVGPIKNEWHSARWEVVPAKLQPPADDPQACIEWAYALLEKETSAGVARDEARERCKVIGDLAVAKMLFARLNTTPQLARLAMSTAAKHAGADLATKREVLAFLIDAYLAAEIAIYPAVDSAVKKAKTVEASALACIKREYAIYMKSETAYYSIDKAIGACR